MASSRRCPNHASVAGLGLCSSSLAWENTAASMARDSKLQGWGVPQRTGFCLESSSHVHQNKENFSRQAGKQKQCGRGLADTLQKRNKKPDVRPFKEDSNL